MTKTKKPSLAFCIVCALALGVAVGLFMTKTPDIATTYIQPFGTIFLNLVKFVVVPIVFFSIISGIISMRDVKKVGSIGIKTVIFYFCTTAIAIVIGLAITSLFKGWFSILDTSGLSYDGTASESVGLLSTFVNLFPSNIITPFSSANMLQVIVASILFGFGILYAGEKGEVFAKFVDSVTAVCLAIMGMILKLSPLAVFCLITPVVAVYGVAILSNLLIVIACAYLCYILHMAIVYSTAVKVWAGIAPKTFFKTMFPTMIFAFSSSSSVGTLPLNMESCTQMGAKKEIASFILPLGTTINMDGTAIYQGVCAVFIATCYGINLTIDQMAVIVLTATLASIGTAGVPGAGVFMLAMVLESVGLPLDGIALVLGVDRIFDMGRTVVNITGDAACTLVVSKMDENGQSEALPIKN
ncbi:MAG: dicarboxylate/amino acid:cation symporter [Bacillota bacterium]